MLGTLAREGTRDRHREHPGTFAKPRALPPRRLDRFEKTNEMLLNFNNLSSVRMQQMNERFLHHTKTLVEMKKDLDSIFRRIRWAAGTGVHRGLGDTMRHSHARGLREEPQGLQLRDSRRVCPHLGTVAEQRPTC